MASLLVLAGGRATRLGGQRKALIRVGGRAIVERVLDALMPLVDESLLLVHDADMPSFGGARLVIDPQPYVGPLAALIHGLESASGEVCLVVAGDMPFVSRSAFAYLLKVQADSGAAVVVPYVDGYIESMHAVVDRHRLLHALDAAQRQGEQRVFRVLQTLDPRLVTADELRQVDPQLRTLFNIDSPEDLAAAERIASNSAASAS
jgi:molybdopterin-guanine dinucleotide biosynthesis protein A